MRWQGELHEEADNPILIHIKDMLVQDQCKSFLISTVDTDVVVIILAFMPYLMYYSNDVIIIGIDFGKGKNRRLISINKSFQSLGHSFSRALLFLHVFTVCDSTFSFFGRA